MASCPKCDGFAQRFNIGSLREYLDFVRQLIEIVNQGTFFLACASCPLQDMFNTPIPGDTISHDFQCLMCGRSFHLFADTYHGNASWRVGELPKPTGDLAKPN
jgi:hypothetical protein